MHLEVFVLAGSLVSAGLCGWLLFYSLPKLNSSRSTRLLLKQLAVLAWADLSQALVGLVYSVGGLGIIPRSIGQITCDLMDSIVWTLWLWGLTVSILVEVHIAAAIFATAMRSEQWLRTLKRGLPWLWLLAFTIALTDHFITWKGALFDTDRRTCSSINRIGQNIVDGGFAAPLVCMVAALCLLWNAVVYALLSLAPGRFQSHVTPQSVERRSTKRMLRFCLITVFTWIPFWLVTFTGHYAPLFWPDDWLGLFSALPMSLNGALNVWAYAMHNRHVKRAMVDGRAPGELNGRDASFTVAFEDTVDCMDIPGRGAPAALSTSMASSDLNFMDSSLTSTGTLTPPSPSRSISTGASEPQSLLLPGSPAPASSSRPQSPKPIGPQRPGLR